MWTKLFILQANKRALPASFHYQVLEWEKDYILFIIYLLKYDLLSMSTFKIFIGGDALSIASSSMSPDNSREVGPSDTPPSRYY